MKTTALRTQDLEKKWYLIDCSGKTLGRLSVIVANILRGKSKPEYTPNADVGDFVVLINTKEIKVTGNKSTQKKYFSHTGFPGGLKTRSFSSMLQKNPNSIIKNAVKGMLPKNRLNNKIIKKLKIYANQDHPHEAQKLEDIKL
tara:strand:+ start:954 stop:1382 length:429 start_codon:yes stop_codon:yes gene_type:complete